MRKEKLRGLGITLLFSIALAFNVQAGGCDSVSQITEGIHWTAVDVGELIGTVSTVVEFTLRTDPEVWIELDDWIVLPGARTVVGYVDLFGGTLANVEKNFSDVLGRVGDLVLEQLGDWSLGLVIVDGYSYTYTVGYLPTIISDDETGLMTSEIIEVESASAESIAKMLDLLEKTMVAIDPSGEGNGDVSRYIPGIGAYLKYGIIGFEAEPELDECSEWMALIQDVLLRVGDLVFEALEENDRLIIATDSLGYRMGYLCFSISAETMGSPDEWDVYLVGAG